MGLPRWRATEQWGQVDVPARQSRTVASRFRHYSRLSQPNYALSKLTLATEWSTASPLSTKNWKHRAGRQHRRSVINYTIMILLRMKHEFKLQMLLFRWCFGNRFYLECKFIGYYFYKAHFYTDFSKQTVQSNPSITVTHGTGSK